MLMKHRAVCLVFLVGFICTNAIAGQLVKLELEDGSIVSGEIVSYEKGIFTISSSSMGIVEINESNIRSIRYPSQRTELSTPDRTSNRGVNQEMQALQGSMINNEQVLNMILSLQNDPKVQKVLNDPDIMNAVLAGDISALMSNPKFMELLNHPKVQEIQKNMTK